ncbi:MAG: porin [Piscirickettsiaceae bacterium]|nr:MAG: porin [Piscirickettsiaceae bacterium]PCH83606.1 MAG: porin [Piscirickettsiaceae bacterium]PCI66804.1 MAG: porin [Piscirickettsiaceae bacterium]
MKIFTKVAASLALMVVLASSSSVAFAGSELMTLLKVLRDNGTITAEQYERVIAEAQATQQQAAEDKKALQAKLDKATDVEVSVKGGINVKTKDGAFATKLGGRLQMDAAYVGEDGPEQGDGTDIRRARLSLSGKMYNVWGFKLENDFTKSGLAGITDAYITYNGQKNHSYKVGHFRDSIILQELNSDNDTQFMERALLSAFGQSRHMGIGNTYTGKNWTSSIALFGDKAKVDSKTSDEGWGVNGRFTATPIRNKTSLVHVGIAADYRKLRSDANVRFKSGPESHLGGLSLVDTGTMADSDNFLVSGLEVAFVNGGFNGQAEYVRTDVERHTASDVSFDGWYAQMGYVLTGEVRPYKGSKFGRIKPKSIFGQGGTGAWEIVARYSTVDLTDKDINGGEEDNVTVGVNWYATPTLRFMANYVKVLTVDGGANDGVEPDIFQTRFQWAF